MDIVVTSRQLEISDRFRKHLTEKLAKVEQMAPRTQRLDVHVTHENNPRQSDIRERVEITVWGKGPVIRSEAAASDKYAALDLSYGKLVERLRRARDRKKIHHGRRRPRSLAEAGDSAVEAGAVEETLTTAAELVPQMPSANGDADRAPLALADGAAEEHPPSDAQGDCPVLIREKVFPGKPISLDEALNRMELVGHDFYLFVDASTGRPCVVYRRRGWSYGVIALDPALGEEPEADDGEYGYDEELATAALG